jgi:hypothetical protein
MVLFDRVFAATLLLDLDKEPPIACAPEEKVGRIATRATVCADVVERKIRRGHPVRTERTEGEISRSEPWALGGTKRHLLFLATARGILTTHGPRNDPRPKTMTQQAGGGLDPVAVLGAVTGTLALAIELYRVATDRPKLRAQASFDWPASRRSKEAHGHAVFGERHVRVEITNVGARAITLRSAGLTIKFDEPFPSLYSGIRARIDAIRRRLMRRLPDVGTIPMTKQGADQYTLLGEGESWVLHLKDEEVAYFVADQGRGPAVIEGVYATTTTGHAIRWPARKAIADQEILKLGKRQDQGHAVAH